MKEPYDPYCDRYASEMPDYDTFFCSSKEELDSLSEDELKQRRNAYVRSEEGTYNPANGHFACDRCYIKIGFPSSPSGWRAS